VGSLENTLHSTTIGQKLVQYMKVTKILNQMEENLLVLTYQDLEMFTDKRPIS